jgi:glycosyltransferase involved in cell wall biosynthesis
MIASDVNLGPSRQLTERESESLSSAIGPWPVIRPRADAVPSTMSPKSITVIFPAYNEEQNIRSAIARALESMRPRFHSFELLIIDDGSTDRTGEVAEDLASKHPEITVIHNRQNLGLGETLYRGFQCARGELVIQNAMDYPLDLRDLDKMIPLLEEADVIVAARKAYAGYSPYRKVTSRVNRLILRWLFEPRLRDYNYTQLFKREVLTAARPTSRSTVFIAPEIIIRAHELGFRIREVDIDYHPRVFGEATSGKPKVILRSVRDMFMFWIRRRMHIGDPVQSAAVVSIPDVAK